MQINNILNIHDDIVMMENRNLISGLLNKLKGFNWKKAKGLFKSSFDNFVKMVMDSGQEKEVLEILNRSLGINAKTLKSLSNRRVSESKGSVNEGLGDWWKEAAGNFYGAMSFYPLLTVFLELDKVVKGADNANVRAVIIYSIIWLLVITGKVAANAISGRKSNDDQTVKASLHPSQVGR
jgi:hypothetical protein